MSTGKYYVVSWVWDPDGRQPLAKAFKTKEEANVAAVILNSGLDEEQRRAGYRYVIHSGSPSPS
jgi:hypothetical protein